MMVVTSVISDASRCSTEVLPKRRGPSSAVGVRAVTRLVSSSNNPSRPITRAGGSGSGPSYVWIKSTR